jgi:hypothetical protein
LKYILINLQAVSDARIIGFCCPGNLLSLGCMQPIYLRRKEKQGKNIYTKDKDNIK